MNCNVPKLPQNSQVVVERSFFKITETGPASSDNFTRQRTPLEAPDLGGYPFIVSITGTASGVSLSTVRTYNIVFISREGVVPAHEMQRHQLAENMELIINPTGKKG